MCVSPVFRFELHPIISTLSHGLAQAQQELQMVSELLRQAELYAVANKWFSKFFRFLEQSYVKVITLVLYAP